MKKVNLEEELNKPIEEPKVVEQPKEVEKPKVEEPIKLSKRAYEAAVALDDALKAFKTAEVEYTSEDVRSLAISFLISADKGTPSYAPKTYTNKPRKENAYSIDTGKLDPHGDGNLFKIPDEKYTNPKLPEYRSATGKSAYWRTKRPNNYSCKFDGANGGFYDLVNGELVKV